MFIYTTQTAVKTLKKTAKLAVKQSSSLKLSDALENVAKLAGYESYHHLNQCLKKSSQMELGWAPPLPATYVNWFEQFSSKLTDATQNTFDNETIFAFNDKDSDENLDRGGFEEVHDAWILCGQDIARQSLFSSDDQSETAIDIFAEQEMKEIIQADLSSYRYFRVQNINFDDIHAIKSYLDNTVFFYPDYVWHKGICLNLR